MFLNHYKAWSAIFCGVFLLLAVGASHSSELSMHDGMSIGPQMGNPHDIIVDDLRVRLLGNAPKLIIWDDSLTSGTTDDGDTTGTMDDDMTSGTEDDDGTSESRKFMIEFNQLLERTPDGKKVNETSVETFAPEDFAIEVLDTPTTSGNLPLHFTILATGSISRPTTPTSVTITAYVFLTSGTVEIDGEPVDVERKDVKFAVEIENWPFVDEENELELNLALKTPGLTPEMTGSEIDLGSRAFLLMEQTATVDEDTTVTVDTDLRSTGTVTRIVVTFPSFEQSLDYDPLFFTAEEMNMQQDDIRTRILGHSGKIQYWRDDETTGPRKFTVEHNDLVEILPASVLPPTTDSLTMNRFETFANQDFMFSDLTEVGFPGFDAGTTVAAKMVTFTAPLSVNGEATTTTEDDQVSTLTVETYLFSTSGTISVDGEPVDVEEGYLKFNVNIDGWPFLDVNNELLLELAVKTPFGDLGNDIPQGEAVDLGDDTFLVLADTAVIDEGTSPGMTLDVRSVVVREGEVFRIYIAFPSFTDNVKYDPIIYSLPTQGDVPKVTGTPEAQWMIYK